MQGTILSEDVLYCYFCSREAVAKATAYVYWNLCELHALSAGAMGFWPRFFFTGIKLNPENSVREYFLRIEHLRRNYPELVARGYLAGQSSDLGNTQVARKILPIPKVVHSDTPPVRTEEGSPWIRKAQEDYFLKSLGLDGQSK